MQGRVKEVWKQSSFTAIYKEVYLYRRAGCPAEKVSSTKSYGVGRWLDHCRTTAPFHKQEKQRFEVFQTMSFLNHLISGISLGSIYAVSYTHLTLPTTSRV